MIATAEKTNGHAKPAVRKELAEFAAEWQKSQRNRRANATYDAARDTLDNANYWANADSYDADSANSRAIREKIVPRARYEAQNNGYADGIIQTYATSLVGVGPDLRMQTGSTGFNQLVEAEWGRWCKAVRFRRKLWCMAHAKVQDGEAFGILRKNPGLKHPVKLDLCLYETEQIQTPNLPFSPEGYIDGIKFDQFGNVEWYDCLKAHPGGNISWFAQEPERVRPQFVLHWFALRRPGQHRGIPEMASTLNLGACSRRFREATLASAETAADFSVLLETQFEPHVENQTSPAPMSQFQIDKRMMVALPNSVKAHQLAAEHPNSTYDTFLRYQINELARPLGMPFNVAACDSASYNYSSGRLDHQVFYGGLDVAREDGNDLVLDVAFDVWFDLAIATFGWLGGEPEAVGPAARAHGWDWPKHRVADVESEANANDKRLRNGTVGYARLSSDSGEDYEDELIADAAAFGITPDELRKVRLHEVHPTGAAVVFGPQQPAPQQPQEPSREAPQ